MIPYQARFRKSYISTAFVLAFLLSLPLRAQEGVLELDSGQTRIEFSLNATLHTIHGTFRLKNGTIRFNSITGKASGLVVVDVTSGESGSPMRDRKMHKEILQSQQFPEATFTPTRINGKLDPNANSEVAVIGIFKLHGSDHEVIMTFQVHQAGDRLNTIAHFVIPYEQWGLKNPSTLFLRVSNKVEIDVHAVGRLISVAPR